MTTPPPDQAAAGDPPYAPYGAPPTGQYPLAPPYAAPYGAPAYGQTPTAAYGGQQLAAWGWRVLSYLIDDVAVLVPALLLGVLTGSRGVYDLVAIVGGFAIGYLNGSQGQSPGKRVIGLKVLREQDGQVIGGGMGIVRQICHFVDAITFLVGFLWPLWDGKRQTFADKIVSTVVIKL